MEQTFMKEKKILPLVLSMALPMVLSMAVNSLYNIVDSYFVARYSEDAMTALALVYPMQNLITAVTVGFGIGVNAVIIWERSRRKRQTVPRRRAFFGILCMAWRLPYFALPQCLRFCVRLHRWSRLSNRRLSIPTVRFYLPR